MHEIRVIGKAPTRPSEDGTEQIDFGDESGRQLECVLVVRMYVFLFHDLRNTYLIL